MDENSTSTASSDSTSMQFSLRSMFAGITAVAWVLSMTLWLQESGFAIAVLSLGVILVAIGILSKRKRYVVAGCLAFSGFLVALPWAGSAVHWVGHQRFPITVRVQDGHGDPVANATVQLTSDGGTATATTDSNGVAVVVSEFMTCGTDRMRRRTGGIQLFRHQIAVQADGYKAFQRNLADVAGTLGWDLYASTSRDVLVELEIDKSTEEAHLTETGSK